MAGERARGFPLYVHNANAEDPALRRELERLRRRLGEERAAAAVGSELPGHGRRAAWVAAAALVLAVAGVAVALAVVGGSPSTRPSLGAVLQQHGVQPGTPVGVAGVVPADQLVGYPLVVLPAAGVASLGRVRWVVLGAGTAGAISRYVAAHGVLVARGPAGVRLYRLSAPPRPAPPVPPVPPPPLHRPASPAPAPGVVVVGAGDSFWTIAAHVVAGHLHRSPTAGQIAPVWQAMVAANQGRLVHPGNPDLIYPGQVLVVPAT